MKSNVHFTATSLFTALLFLATSCLIMPGNGTEEENGNEQGGNTDTPTEQTDDNSGQSGDDNSGQSGDNSGQSGSSGSTIGLPDRPETPLEVDFTGNIDPEQYVGDTPATVTFNRIPYDIEEFKEAQAILG